MSAIESAASMDADDRREAWYGGFAWQEDTNYWDYPQCLVMLLTSRLEQIEELVGADHAASPLRELVEPVAKATGGEAATWRDVIENDPLDAGTVWPISDRLEQAGLYGIYGVTPQNVPLPERATWIENMVSQVVAFASRPELASVLGEDNAIQRIARVAQSRRALDTGQGEVDIVSMSVLGRVSEGRLRNLMSGSTPTLERGPSGGVAATSALAWLQKRKEFLHSIWDQAEDRGPVNSENRSPLDTERLMFVPVARDNSIFHPGLLRNGLYQIGPKGSEQHFANFDEALDALNAMPVPRWRRPNEYGNWGIVTGVAWQRVDRRHTNDQ